MRRKHPGAPQEKVPHKGASFTAGRTAFPKTTLADLKPGDIGFQVQRAHRDFKQFWITVGGRWAAWRRKPPTDPFIVHAFVVVQAHPETLRLHTVDGAGDNYTGIDDVMMSFGKEKFRVVPGARYAFFRPNDADLATRFVHVARNWAAPDMHNFGYTRAVASPFHSLRFDQRARSRAAILAPQGRIDAAPKTAEGKIFKMSCSEFVANTIAAAVMNKWQDEHPQQQGTGVITGLYQGALGQDFAIDTKGVTPPQLELMLEDGRYWQPVGYLSENG